MSGAEKPHAQNAAGPFYVFDGCCTAHVGRIESPGFDG